MDANNPHDLIAEIEELKRQNLILKETLEKNNFERDDFITNTINCLSDPIFVKDHESRLLVFNNVFCDIFGLKRLDIIGKTLAEDVPPEERESFLAIDNQVLKDGITNINKETLTVRNSPTKTIITTKSRFQDSKGSRFLVGIIKDVTEKIKTEEDLRLSEEHFKGLFTQSHISSAIVDLKNIILQCNNSFCEFLGYSEKELIGKSIEEYSHPDDYKIIPKAVKEIISGNKEITVFQKRYVKKDGSIIWGEKSISLINDKDQKPLYFLHVILDITDRYLALEKLKKNQTELQESVATKDKMFSIISHDLISPINSTLGLIELLSDESFETSKEEQKEYLALAKTSIENTFNLIDNLLNWANSQRGRIKVSPSSFKLLDTIERVFNTLKAAATVKSINLFHCINSDVNLFTDKNLFETVIINLISNAIKFTEIGGEIKVLSTVKKDKLEISKIDNGVGMQEIVSQKLFNSSSHKSTLGTANEKGSGLGLALCKDFVT